MPAALTPREQRLLARRREPVPLIWAEPFHQAWAEGAGLPAPLRLARATRARWRESEPVIKDDELVLGRSGICPTVTTSWASVVQFDGDRCRELLAQSDDPEDRVLLEEIIKTWNGKDFSANVTQAWRQQGIDLPVPGAGPGPWPGHATQQYSLFLQLGAIGMRDRIARGRAANPAADTWYDSLLEIVDGLCELGQAVRASAQAAAEGDVTPQRRDELLELAATLSHCPEHPPRTFREAVQTFWLVFYANGADSCARIDRDLGPYLDRDLASGAISEHEARELISSLWIRFEEHRTWSAVIGGVDEQGEDVCNAFTWMALEACERLGLEAPNLALRVHPGTPNVLLREACRVVSGGGGMPSLVNDVPIIESLCARGVCLEDARDYALTGCAQVVVPGRSYGTYEDVMGSALKWLELALHNGYDRVLQRQAGPPTGTAEELQTFDGLMAAWQTQMRAVLDLAVAKAAINLRVLGEAYPSPLRSLLGYDTVETGVDVRLGGYRHNEGLADVLGVTNLSDSLAVIRSLVFEGDNGSPTLPELVAILDANWSGHEPLRERCIRDFPKFGNGLPEHDAFAASLLETIQDELASHTTGVGGGTYNLDVIGWTGHVVFGKDALASPDGRRDGDPLADSCGASQGRDTSGPTALLRSAAQLGHRRAHGVLALTLLFTRDTLDSPDGLDSLIALVKSYFEMGGQQLQFNCVDAQTLRDAQARPEHYESLVVRVGGFSAHWTRLDEDMQEAIIARTEHALPG